MRMEEFRGVVTVVNDAYNANPASMAAALAEFGRRRATGRKILVCGDMLEMGAAARARHEMLGRTAAGSGIDWLCAVGGMADAVAAGAEAEGMARDRIRAWPDAAAAARELPPLVAKGDLIWLKGSRRVGLETVAKAVRERFHAV